MQDIQTASEIARELGAIAAQKAAARLVRDALVEEAATFVAARGAGPREFCLSLADVRLLAELPLARMALRERVLVEALMAADPEAAP